MKKFGERNEKRKGSKKRTKANDSGISDGDKEKKTKLYERWWNVRWHKKEDEDWIWSKKKKGYCVRVRACVCGKSNKRGEMQ